MDTIIFNLINGLAGKSDNLDKMIFLIAQNPIIKGFPIAAVFIFLWHKPNLVQITVRIGLIAILALSVLSIVIGRLSAMALPYRPRPLHTEGLDMNIPISVRPEALDGWTSFPSDHAVLYASLTAGFWIVNRWAGVFVAIHSLVIIAFSRIYLGFHHPTDIAGGAFIGVVVTLLVMPPATAAIKKLKVVGLFDKWPHYFYPALFMFLFQISTMFNSARELAKSAMGFLRSLIA